MFLSEWPDHVLIRWHWEIHIPQFNLIVIIKRKTKSIVRTGNFVFISRQLNSTIWTKSIILCSVLAHPTCDFCLSSPLYPIITFAKWACYPSFQLDESSHLSSVSSPASHYSSVFLLFQAPDWLILGVLHYLFNETMWWPPLIMWVCVRLPQASPTSASLNQPFLAD